MSQKDAGAKSGEEYTSPVTFIEHISSGIQYAQVLKTVFLCAVSRHFNLKQKMCN